MPRDAFFVVSKLVGERDPAAHAPAGVEAATRAALGRETRALDCHAPRHAPLAGRPCWPPTARWRNLDAGLTRTVGLSNVRADQLEFLLREARIPPAVVEQEVHPYNQESALVSLCRSRGVALLAHSPLGSAKLHARLLAEPTLVEIARRRGASVAAVVLRWHVQRGVVPIPSSRDLAHLRANFAAAAAPPLSADDMAAVARLDRRERGWPKPNLVDAKEVLP